MNERPKIFLINLERSAERRTDMERQLAACGLDFEVVLAVDGRTIAPADLARYDRAERLRQYGADLTLAELGCYLSHLKLYERVVLEGRPAAVIMEDDVFIQTCLPEVLDAVAGLQRRWDLIRLAGLRRRRYKLVSQLDPSHQLVRLLNGACGSQCYVVSQNGARKLVRYCSTALRQIDVTLDAYWEHRLDMFAVQPYPVHEGEIHASIITAEGRTDAVERGPLLSRLRRRGRKLRASIIKRWYNLTVYGGL